MKIKAYIKMCMLLIYLSVIPCYLVAQTTETTINESADSTHHATGSPVTALFELLEDSLGRPIQTRSCVNTVLSLLKDRKS